MIIRLALSVVLILTAIAAFAVGNCDGSGNCYVSNWPMWVTGDGSGRDWTNACTDFTGACDVTNIGMRGTTIWVAGTPGNPYGPPYAHMAFSAPDNGTQTITIMAATPQNHGTNTGYHRQYGLATVLFAPPVIISSDYWIINGQRRPIGGGGFHDQYITTTGYHLQVIQTSASSPGAIQVTGSNVTLDYVEVLGINHQFGGNQGTGTDIGIYYGSGVNNEILSHSWIYGTGGDLVSISSDGSNFIFEYNLFSRNHTGVATQKSQAISIGVLSGFIVRYNHFHNITGIGVITDINADATSFAPNWYIYGNDFFWTTVGSNSGSIELDVNHGLTGGIVNLVGENLNGGVIQIYNNDFLAFNGTACVSTVACNSYALTLNGTVGGTCAAHTRNCGTTTATVYNNVWYDPHTAANFFVNSAANPQWNPSGDFGEAFGPATGFSNGGTFTTTGTHDTTSLTGNPFVLYGDHSSPPTTGGMCGPNWYCWNLRPKADTADGLSIPGWTTTPPGCTSGVNCESDDNEAWFGAAKPRGVDAANIVSRGASQFPPAKYLTGIVVKNTALGIHPGQTVTELPYCYYNDGSTDICPELGGAFTKKWVSYDSTIATVDANGNVTAGSATDETAFIEFDYGGFSNREAVVSMSDPSIGEPIAALPTKITRSGSPFAFSSYDTTAFDAAFPVYLLPTGGCTWTAQNGGTNTPCTGGVGNTTVSNDWTGFAYAVNNSKPGDVIVLQANTQYINNTLGTLSLPQRPNPLHKWTYIISSAMASLPSSGTRINPVKDGANMPKVITSTVYAPIQFAAGADHWRLVGLEVYTNAPCNASTFCTIPNLPVTGTLITTQADNVPANMPDSIILDRMYIHGDNDHDITHAVVPNATNFEMVDSWVSDVHQHNDQVQAIAGWQSPGPMKFENSYLSGMAGVFILGGAGGYSNVWVQSDVLFRHNYVATDPHGRMLTVAGCSNSYDAVVQSQWETVNDWETKNVNRVLLDGNIFEYNWCSAQGGAGLVINTGTGVNGADATNRNMTISNNIIDGTLTQGGAVAFSSGDNCVAGTNGPGITSTTADPPGGYGTYAGQKFAGTYFEGYCLYPGSGRFINFLNNVWVQGAIGQPYGKLATGAALPAVTVNRALSEVTWRHNTFVGPYTAANHDPSNQHSYCERGFQFSAFWASNGVLTDIPPTSNIWMNDNVACRTNDLGGGPPYKGQTYINWAISDPSTIPVSTRHVGNIMYYPPGDIVPTGASAWANGSLGTTMDFTVGTNPFHFINPTIGNYTLNAQPTGSTSSDGAISGIDYTTLINHQLATSLVITGPLGNGNIGIGYTTTLLANGGTRPYTTWTLASGSLPPGLSIISLFGGGYALSGWPTTAGSYAFSLTVTDSAGTTSNPQLYTVTIGTQSTYTVSGKIAGAVLGGVSVKLVERRSGASVTVTSDSSGNYSFPTLGTSSYVVIPTLVGYKFTPANSVVNVAGANASGVNFTSVIATVFTISGTISGAVTQGVTLTMTGCASGSTTSSVSGTYTLTGALAGTCTVIPSETGYTFSPVSTPVTITTADVTGINFTSTRVVSEAALNATSIGPGGAVVLKTKPKKKKP